MAALPRRKLRIVTAGLTLRWGEFSGSENHMGRTFFFVSGVCAVLIAVLMAKAAIVRAYGGRADVVAVLGFVNAALALLCSLYCFRIARRR